MTNAAGHDPLADHTPHFVRGRHYFLLLCTLVCFILVQSFFANIDHAAITGGFTTLVLLAAALSLAQNRRQSVVVLTLGVPFLLTIWIDVATGQRGLFMVRLALGGAFLSYATVILMRDVFSRGQVTRDTLYGAVCIYLMLAIVWSFVYLEIEAIHPGSFNGIPPGLSQSEVGMKALYFSVVTLTTLGYGDITPESLPARTAAALEAVTGVLYIAMLVARLVAKYAVEVESHRP